MRSLLKKSDSFASQMPAWHPNFRNYEQLPDVKVVRTAFFINGFAALIAFGLLVWFGMREYRLYTINAQIQATQSFIDRDQANSDAALALYRNFQSEEKRVQEVADFVKSRPTVSMLLQRFAETRPATIALDQLDLKGDGITLRATVEGAAEAAVSDYNAYVDLLNKDSVFSNDFASAELTVANRDLSTGWQKIEVSIKLKEPGK